jgi:Tol biopolymer transport system component
MLVGLVGVQVAAAPPASAAGGLLLGPYAGKWYGSILPEIGANGRVIVYASLIQNFGAPEQPPFLRSIYFRDRGVNLTGTAVKPLSGTFPNGHSIPLAVSPDPETNYVLYWSEASNLVPGDTLGHRDIFLGRRTTGVAERVSVGAGGVQANGPSSSASMSGNLVDGNPRYVAFSSDATNLVAGDTNGTTDVFVRDRVANTTTRVSLGNGGVQSNGNSADPQISDDGRYVVFASTASNLVPGDTNGLVDVFVRDVVAGTTERVSVGYQGQAEGSSFSPAISADARFIAFESDAENLVPLDENISDDVFVRDRVMGTTERVSVSSDDIEGTDSSGEPSMSRDGRFVAFESAADELNGFTPDGWTIDGNLSSDAYVRDRLARVTQRASERGSGVEAWGDAYDASISPDGRWVGFYGDSEEYVGEANDSNMDDDVFLKDMGPSWGTGVTGSRFRTVTPKRVLDTSAGPVPAGSTVGTKLSSGTTLDVPVTGGSTGVPATATAVLLNLAATGETAANAELTVYPTGTTKPTTVALQPRAGASTSNQVAVAVGTGGKVSVATNTGATHVRADVIGYYAVDDLGAFTPLPVLNAFNTSNPQPGFPLGRPLAVWTNRQIDLQVTGELTGIPDSASAVVLSVLSTAPSSLSTAISVFPTGTTDPGVPTVFPNTATMVTNTVTSAIGAGGQVSMAITGTGSTHLMVSIVGYYSGFGSDLFFPLSQTRVIDTRSTKATLNIPGHTGPLTAGLSKGVNLAGRGGIPANAQSLALALSSVQPTNPIGLLLTWGASETPQPMTALGTGVTSTNGMVTGVGPNARLEFFNFSASVGHLLADSYGYFR